MCKSFLGLRPVTKKETRALETIADMGLLTFLISIMFAHNYNRSRFPYLLYRSMSGTQTLSALV